MSSPLIFVFGICFGVILSVSIVAHMPGWLAYFRGEKTAITTAINAGHADIDLTSSHNNNNNNNHNNNNHNNNNIATNPSNLAYLHESSHAGDNSEERNGISSSIPSNLLFSNKQAALSTVLQNTAQTVSSNDNSDTNNNGNKQSFLQKVKARTRWSPGTPVETSITDPNIISRGNSRNSNGNTLDNLNSVNNPLQNNGSPITSSSSSTASAAAVSISSGLSAASNPNPDQSSPSPLVMAEREHGRRKRRDRPNAALALVAGSGNFSTDDVVIATGNKRSVVLYKEIDNVVMREAVPEDKVSELLSSQDSIGADGARYYSHPPWTPYHSQSYVAPLSPPYIPTLNSVKAYRETLKGLLKSDKINNNVLRSYSERTMPNMQLQKADYEGDNLKFHLCNGVFEAYSASYVTTREHMLEVKSEKYNLSFVNCEMASFIHMRESANFFKNKYGKGLIMQTLDVLDLSVIHLSAFERSSLKHKFKLWKGKKDLDSAWKNIDPVIETAKLLEARINPKKTGKPLLYTEEAKRTVVVMPFLGGAMGAGHSVLGNRFEYLKACFWSFYEFIPNIVIGVSRKEDVHWGFFDSGLPFFDILLLEGLPKGASLPVGTTQYVKRLFESGNKSWLQFDYVFFSESDQILMSRVLPLVHYHLKLYPSHMILPHRLMPYSGRVIQEVHNKTKDAIVYNEWMYQSCCLERQNCQERKSWHPLAHEHVPVINYYGLYVPLGNVNFLDEKYRACEIMSYTPDFCP